MVSYVTSYHLLLPVSGPEICGSSAVVSYILPRQLKCCTTSSSSFSNRNKVRCSLLHHLNRVTCSVPHSTRVLSYSERPPALWPPKGYPCVAFGGRCTVKAANSSRFILAGAVMDTENSPETTGQPEPMKVLFVEMGVGYDQHGQDITAAAMRACKDAISSNSIPAFRTGAIPGVNSDKMKLKIRLGVPHSTQGSLDIERVKSVFPYGDIIEVEVVDGGLVCSSGVCLESMGDKNDDCYIVNAAVYVGY